MNQVENYRLLILLSVDTSSKYLFIFIRIPVFLHLTKSSRKLKQKIMEIIFRYPSEVAVVRFKKLSVYLASPVLYYLYEIKKEDSPLFQSRFSGQ